MARPMPEVKGVTHRRVRARDVELHVAEAGEGEPVILLHGWPQHWYEWRHVIPLLAERWRVICPDLRGLGWSDAPARGYEKEQMAVDTLRLMDAMGLDRVRLIGHDWGGLAGLLLCLRVPDRVRGYLVMNTGHPWSEVRGRPALQTWRLWYQGVLSMPLVGQAAARPMVEAMYRVGGVNRDRVSREEWATFVDQFREPARARATVGIYRSFLLRELPSIVRGRYRSRRLTVPTLFMLGAKDPVIQEAMIESALPHADEMTLELVPGAGHFIADEMPELVAERALSFLGD
jgi:pimeloyl-ACP methyl ester carboxylesterase